MQKPGQPDYTFAADTAEAELFLSGLPAGQTINIPDTAVNVADESVPSAPVAVLVL